jgi:hypothetical protein
VLEYVSQMFERLVVTLLDLDDLHGALAQIRRFADVGQWVTADMHGLLFQLGTWAQQDESNRKRFLELQFSKKVKLYLVFWICWVFPV